MSEQLDSSDYFWLPTQYRSIVTQFRKISLGLDIFTAVVRTDAQNADDLVRWRQEFQQHTNMNWILRRTYSSISHLELRTTN